MRRALRITRRLATVVVVAAVVAAVAPAAGNAPDGVEAQVRVAGVDLGGLSWTPAREALERSLRRPVRFAFGDRFWSVPVERFRLTADVDAAVTAALRAEEDPAAQLGITVSRARIRAYVDAVASDLDRPSRNARIAGLDGLRPVLVPERAGRELDRKRLVAAIETALLENTRSRVRIALRPVVPEVRVADLPPVVVIQRESKRLHLYERGALVRTFPIATGTSEFPTPLGQFTIVDMQRNPWWYPPPSDWAKDAEPVPPGPGNPLGTRWMGFDRYMVGIHGTSNSASIGTPASHGCVRMYTWDAEWLFDRVRHGTPVFVLGA